MPNKDRRVLRVPYSNLTYDKRAGAYRGDGGQFVAYSDVRGIIERDIVARRERIEAHATALQRAARATLAGESPQADYARAVEQWRKKHAREVKSLHLAEVAAARGGFHDMGAADFGRAGHAIREQYEYLNNRAAVVANDANYAASGTFLRHTLMYADAGLGTFEAARLDSDKALGMGWEFNEEDAAAKHCEPTREAPSCRQQTELGVVKIGTLVLVSKRACHVKCRCKVHRFATKGEAERAMRAMRQH